MSWKNMAWGGVYHEYAVMGKIGLGLGRQGLAVIRISAEGQGDGNDSTWVHQALGRWLDSVGI